MDDGPPIYRYETLAIMDALAEIGTKIDCIHDALFADGDEEADA